MSNHYPNRRFVIFNVSELSTIDFNQVYETSADTVRKSLDELETFVKFDLPTPSSITALTTKSQEYDYDEILVILDTPEWTDPNPPM
jgi:homogentisate 1,2-dioxygenase